ncbi:hypothetical protein GCM10019017_40780 [Streptomyces showdoensis]
MFRGVLGGPAVGDHLDGEAVRLLRCVGHRDMVRLCLICPHIKKRGADTQLRLTVA